MLSIPNKDNRKRGKVGRISISSFRCDADVLLSSETERGFVEDFDRDVFTEGRANSGVLDRCVSQIHICPNLPKTVQS